LTAASSATKAIFAALRFGAEWTWEDLQEYYGAPASALTFQDNVIDLMFKPGRAAGDPCEIVTMPETSIVTFSNRTQTVPPHIFGRIRLYRPVGESVVYAWGGCSARLDGARANPCPFPDPRSGSSRCSRKGWRNKA
jgi:hypothetical protein